MIKDKLEIKMRLQFNGLLLLLRLVQFIEIVFICHVDLGLFILHKAIVQFDFASAKV